MTFIPSVLTKNDTNNSTTLTTNTTYTGTSTLITGYNTILVTLTSTENSNAGGLEIQFSSDNVNWKAYYTDTYFNGTIFSKTYKIIDSYYRIKYDTDSATFTIMSRLSTVIDNDATSINSFYSNIDDGYHDAFGKLRVSNPYTLLDIKFPSETLIDSTTEFLSNNMIICTKLENATATFGSSKCVMTTLTNGGYYITQSRKYCIYQPGKSLLFLASGIIDDITNSGTYTARIGYFDENNGLFFENNSGSLNVVLRNKQISTYATNNSAVLSGTPSTGGTISTTVGTGLSITINTNIFFQNSTASGTFSGNINSYDSGTGNITINNISNITGTNNTTDTYNILYNQINIVDTSISQNNWNIDKFVGTGISGLNLNFQTSQLFVIDFEWLSVGRIRFGFYLFGRIYYCHQITNVNVLTAPYMLTPNLPIRHEIRLTSGQVTLTQICSSVISEGGYNPIGRPFSINNGISTISAVNNTRTPLLALRGNSTAASSSNNRYNHQNIVPSNIQIFDSTNNRNVFYEILLYLAPSTQTATWQAVNDNSIAEYALGNTITSISGTPIVIDSGYVVGKGDVIFSNLSQIFTNLIQITSNIDNVSYVLVIAATGIGSDAPCLSSINWNESF